MSSSVVGVKRVAARISAWLIHSTQHQPNNMIKLLTCCQSFPCRLLSVIPSLHVDKMASGILTEFRILDHALTIHFVAHYLSTATFLTDRRGREGRNC